MAGPHAVVLDPPLQIVAAGRVIENVARVEAFCALTARALSQAALEVLAVVAYDQPVSRADNAHIRGTDSAGVIDTLLARGVIADEARYSRHGGPRFWSPPTVSCR